MSEIDLERRALLRKFGIGVGAGALALATIKPSFAETVLTDTYIETGETKERLSKSATVVVGKSGAVDYLTTDYGSDDACIQAAIDYVDGLSAGSVLVREGTYIMENKSLVKNNSILDGVGYNTILKADTNLNDAIIENNDQTNGNDNIIIRNMKIDGNSTNQSATGYGIFFDGSSTDNTNITFQNLWIDDVYGQGLHVKGTTDLFLNDVLVNSCGVAADALRHNIYLRRITNLNATNITTKSCVAGKGIKLTICDYVNINNIIAKSNAAEGIYLGDVRYLKLNGISANNNIGVRILTEVSQAPISWEIDCIAYNNTTSGAYIQADNGIIMGSYNGNADGIELANADKVCIPGVRARDNSGYGIKETGSSDANDISGCIVYNNTTGGILTIGNNTIAVNNAGYNPVGAVGPPSVPATTVNYTNIYGYPCQVQVYGGAVTEIDIDDIATGLTSGIFMIPPRGTINITYSAAPSWRWWGL